MLTAGIFFFIFMLFFKRENTIQFRIKLLLQQRSR